jgi:proteasome lid subunit RPN8/RPN11
MTPEAGSGPRLILSEVARDAIARAAEAAHPREACGLLVGRADGRGGARVLAVHPADNLLAGESPDRFELDPAVRLRLQREIRGTELSVLGHWHSHPSGSSAPSATDAAQAFEAGLVWLIQATDPVTGQALALGAQRATGRMGDPERAFSPLFLDVVSDP